MGNSPLKIQGIKEEERKTFSKQLCLSLQDDHGGSGTFVSKCLGEDGDSQFRRWKVLEIDDPFMYYLSDEMNMDLDMFFPLSLYWILIDIECTLVVTPDHSQMVELNVELGEEVL